MRAPRQAPLTAPARDQGIDRDPLPLIRTANDRAGCLMSEDKRWRPARIMAVIAMHVGATDADRVDLDQNFVVAGHGLRLVAPFQRVRLDIDEGFHGLCSDLRLSRCPASVNSQDNGQIIYFYLFISIC